jgi:hypothetical protein
VPPAISNGCLPPFKFQTKPYPRAARPGSSHSLFFFNLFHPLTHRHVSVAVFAWSNPSCVETLPPANAIARRDRGGHAHSPSVWERGGLAPAIIVAPHRFIGTAYRLHPAGASALWCRTASRPHPLCALLALGLHRVHNKGERLTASPVYFAVSCTSRQGIALSLWVRALLLDWELNKWVLKVWFISQNIRKSVPLFAYFKQ